MSTETATRNGFKTFNKLGLHSDIVRSIVDAGYSSPTPIQEASIPVINSGADLIGVAQTGTGKTAAFVLPVLSYLAGHQRKSNKFRPVRALVVTPTRELAMQVEEAVRVYGKYARLRSLAIFGGIPIRKQINSLKRGTDVIVATPGRLKDHLERGTIRLDRVEILMLDEADRMLDMGFQPDLQFIVSHVKKSRQTLLFSATMPASVQKLANKIMHQPELIEIGERRNPAATVKQEVSMVAHDQKADLLRHFLNEEKTESVLVFTRTKYRADRISRKLKGWGYESTVMHSNRSQNQRQRALQGFKSGKFKILVATDVAARGLDVDSISHVVNFDTPDQPEDYIHRIGRTGRADTSGNALTFVSRDERRYLKRIEKHTGKKIEVKLYDDFELIPEKQSYNDGNRGYNTSKSRNRNNGSGSRPGQRRKSNNSNSSFKSRRKGKRNAVSSQNAEGSAKNSDGRAGQSKGQDSKPNSGSSTGSTKNRFQSKGNGSGKGKSSNNFKKKRSFRAKKRNSTSPRNGQGSRRGRDS